MRIDARQRALQHDHGKDGCACGDVACARAYGVGGCHARACVAFGRGQGDACLQAPGRIQQLRAILGEVSCAGPGRQSLGQQLADMPGHAHGMRPFIKKGQHTLVIIQRLRINGKHAAGLAHAHGAAAGQRFMHIARQRGQAVNAAHMRFVLQHGVIQVRDAPALRDGKAKQRGQLLAGVGGKGIAPGAEGDKQPALAVKGQVAVHHA